MPRCIHHQTYEIYNVSGMEKPINNINVYDMIYTLYVISSYQMASYVRYVLEVIFLFIDTF